MINLLIKKAECFLRGQALAVVKDNRKNENKINPNVKTQALVPSMLIQPHICCLQESQQFGMKL